MKRITSLLLCLLLAASVCPLSALTAYAADTPEEVFEFDASAGAITGLTEEGENASELVIPSKIGGVEVKRIETGAFVDCKFTSATIPEELINVEPGAFWNCRSLVEINVSEANPFYASHEGILFNKSLTELVQYPHDKQTKDYTIPSTITAIGFGAFNACQNLVSVTIPSSVKSIGDLAFFACPQMNKINVDTGNTEFASRDGVLFNKSFTALIQYPCSKYGNYVIPDSVEVIKKLAFSFSLALKSVTIPDGVTVIDVKAFECCTSLTSITIPDSVIAIGEEAFASCSSLTDIYFAGSEAQWKEACYWSNSVTDPFVTMHFNEVETPVLFEFNAFSGKITGLTDYGKTLSEIVVPPTIDGVKVTGIFMSAFAYNLMLKSVTLPEGLKTIDESAFSGCWSLEHINIPYTVTAIGDEAFSTCWSLEYIAIPNSVVTIGDEAFYACLALVNITIPNSVTTIGSKAFYGCWALESITVPDSVTSIGDNAFSNCKLLTSIRVDSKNKKYASQNGVLFSKDKQTLLAFPGGRKETSYIVPDGVKTIGKWAFSSCLNIESVIIADGVTSISDAAFADCSSLTSLTIPDSVTKIGDILSSTSATPPLSDIYYGGTEEQWRALAFNTSASVHFTGLAEESEASDVEQDSEGSAVVSAIYETAGEASETSAEASAAEVLSADEETEKSAGTTEKSGKKDLVRGVIIGLLITVVVILVAVVVVVVVIVSKKKKKAQQNVPSAGVSPTGYGFPDGQWQAGGAPPNTQNAPDNRGPAGGSPTGYGFPNDQWQAGGAPPNVPNTPDNRGQGAASEGARADDLPSKFCPRCGYRLSEDSAFCPKCGNKLR